MNSNDSKKPVHKLRVVIEWIDEGGFPRGTLQINDKQPQELTSLKMGQSRDIQPVFRLGGPIEDYLVSPETIHTFEVTVRNELYNAAGISPDEEGSLLNDKATI